MLMEILFKMEVLFRNWPVWYIFLKIKLSNLNKSMQGPQTYTEAVKQSVTKNFSSTTWVLFRNSFRCSLKMLMSQNLNRSETNLTKGNS
jgi:hypothetical protein